MTSFQSPTQENIIQTFDNGDTVLFSVNDAKLEGEVIGVANDTVTVVYIAENGTYSIDKFKKKLLTLKTESKDELNQKRETKNKEEIKNNKQNTEQDNKHIQSIKNTLITLLEYTPHGNTSEAITKQFSKNKEDIISHIQDILESETITSDTLHELSDDEIKTLANNLDFINELIFTSFTEYSIARSTQKPSKIHSAEIQERLSHFDTQAKQLRDKKMQKMHIELFNKRSAEEKKYPLPEVITTMQIITDEKRNELNINPEKQEQFNKILLREKQEKQEFSNHLLKLLRNKRANLLELLKNDRETSSKKNIQQSNSMQELNSIMLAEFSGEKTTEQASAATEQAVYQDLIDLNNSKKNRITERVEVNTTQQLEEKMINIMSDISSNTGIIQQYGAQEGFTSLLFLRIARIIEAKTLATNFLQKYGTDTKTVQNAINNAINTSGDIFAQNLTQLAQPFLANNASIQQLMSSTSINEISEIFRKISLLTTSDIEESKTKILENIADIMKNIIQPELTNGDIIVYTDENKETHKATIVSISQNLPISDPKYHIALSYLNDNKDEAPPPVIFSSAKNEKEITSIHKNRTTAFPETETEKSQAQNKQIISYIQHIYETYNISEEQQKPAEEIHTMSFKERSLYISELIIQNKIINNTSNKNTEQLLDTLASGLSIEPITKKIGENFYRQMQNLPIEKQLQLSATLHFTMGAIIHKWADIIIHGKQILEYITIPHINKKYDLDIEYSQLKGRNMTEKYMHFYALAQNKIHDEKKLEKLKIELSSLFYKAKHIGSTTPNRKLQIEDKASIIANFRDIMNAQSDNATEIIELRQTEQTQLSIEVKMTAANAEEKIAGNIFNTTLSQQISVKTKNHENPLLDS